MAGLGASSAAPGLCAAQPPTQHARQEKPLLLPEVLQPAWAGSCGQNCARDGQLGFLVLTGVS